jgi:peptidoglycan/xylan/chitin deacetylase (PgdA/CDA1 family)
MWWRRLSVLLLCALALSTLSLSNSSHSQEQHQSSAAASSLTPRAWLPSVAREGYHGTFAYTVVPGDTLFSIARRYGTTVETIASLNAIPDPSRIAVGAVIWIPDPPAPTGPSQLVFNGSRNSNLIALTFDMGGRVEPALDIMNWLIANNVRATVFPTGAMVENPNTAAGRQVLALVDANRHLFELGNHSYSHPDFRNISDAAIRDELQRAEAAVRAHTDMPLRPRFRPPYAAYDQRVLNAVGAAGYAQTIMWDIDTIDWRPVAEGGPTASAISQKVLTNARGGSIVLFHLGGFNTLDSLPAIVNGLRASGFEFARLSDLLGP